MSNAETKEKVSISDTEEKVSSTETKEKVSIAVAKDKVSNAAAKGGKALMSLIHMAKHPSKVFPSHSFLLHFFLVHGLFCFAYVNPALLFGSLGMRILLLSGARKWLL